MSSNMTTGQILGTVIGAVVGFIVGDYSGQMAMASAEIFGSSGSLIAAPLKGDNDEHR